MQNDQQSITPTQLLRGITINISHSHVDETLFRCLVYHEGKQIADFTGTRGQIGTRLMSIVAERLFTGPGGPLSMLAGVFGGSDRG